MEVVICYMLPISMNRRKFCQLNWIIKIKLFMLFCEHPFRLFLLGSFSMDLLCLIWIGKSYLKCLWTEKMTLLFFVLSSMVPKNLIFTSKFLIVYAVYLRFYQYSILSTFLYLRFWIKTTKSEKNVPKVIVFTIQLGSINHY